MSGTARQRHVPTQERSRRTVERILEAAEELVGEKGVDAATTREVADRAGIAVATLYRFFADRDEIFDALLEAQLRDLDAYTESVEQEFSGNSVEEVVRMEIELHVRFYERHPAFVELWFGGRVSPPVVRTVRQRNERLARRSQEGPLGAKFFDPTAPPVAFVLLVELGDRLLDVAFRGRRKADRAVIDAGIAGLTAFAERLAVRD